MSAQPLLRDTSDWVRHPLHEVAVQAGPRLLAHLDDGPGLSAHRERSGPLRLCSLGELSQAAHRSAVRGRGGAGFPFAVKLDAAASGGRRPVVVVNAAEGEPASAKDFTLLVRAPHRVLDGAVLSAHALRTRTVHVVTPADRPAAGAAARVAVAERRRAGERIQWRLHTAAPGFVRGQARAVVELMSGREGLPVTAWQPEAVSGVRGRPTLLANAETFAQVAALVRLGPAGYAALGTPGEPGTVLLTIATRRWRRVVEVPFGAPWLDLADGLADEADGLACEDLDRPVLTGGYHGTWAAAGALRTGTVSRVAMAERGLALGAGVVLFPGARGCPVSLTERIVDYLAGESARRCGPCRHGLPALAAAFRAVCRGDDAGQDLARVHRLGLMVERRGACAHPDGTVRLVRSLLAACSAEVAVHEAGGCALAGTGDGLW
ncbi:MAG TPA: NADH-ubiquinone oxidoreductase-F iron-sulfur binding region domain-containing protein [Dermatophilaceae bacterium]|nr:NADH-ubiquinone oxidoreductase-F iron-sulfur binding region domain-containing protein [Dermatophilaceae bacterium]